MDNREKLEEKLIEIHGDRDVVRRIIDSNILLVGAGGIGCEVIKGLLLYGFPAVTILDLDTIDVSNLNRQFLFQKCHIGESKAKVAANVAVERFSHRHPVTNVPLSTVIPIHDSILEMKYGKSFYERFTFVINALDNNKTRVHVNRLCLAANIPLIESGSTGYKGNTRIILAGKTECFECNPVKKDENTYASCTIRHTPTAPIHCIVWAKHLFAQLFGEADEDIAPDGSGALPTGDEATIPNGDEAALPNGKSSDEQATNGGDQKHENNGQNGNHDYQQNGVEKTLTTREYVEQINYDPRGVFQKIFFRDIAYLKEAFPHMWENRKPPQEISYDDIISGKVQFTDSRQNGTNDVDLTNPVIRDQQLWSIGDCLEQFIASLTILKTRLNSLKPGDSLTWDKDDDPSLSFVTAASNFRCYIFSIERKSKFDVKSLAGNIIPSIPSTNTVVGGCVIIQAINLVRSMANERFIHRNEQWNLNETSSQKEADNVLKNGFEAYVTNSNEGPKLISLCRPTQPKPKCMVCSKTMHQIDIGLCLESTSVIDFVNDIIIKTLHCIAPDVIIYGSDTVLWGPDLDELIEMHKKSPKMLSEYTELNSGDCLLLIEDIAQDYSVHIKLVDMKLNNDDNDENDTFFKILNQNELDKISPNNKHETAKTEPDNGIMTIGLDDDVIFVFDAKQHTNGNGTHKRSLDDNGTFDQGPIKKLRTEISN